MQDSVSLDKLSLDSDRLRNYNYDYQKEIYIYDLANVVVPLFPDNPPSALCECHPPLLLSAYSCSYSRGPLSLCWVLRNIRCLVKISFGQYPVGEMSSEDHSHRMWLPLPLLELGALGIIFRSLSNHGLSRSYSLSSGSRHSSSASLKISVCVSKASRYGSCKQIATLNSPVLCAHLALLARCVSLLIPAIVFCGFPSYIMEFL